MFLSGLLIGSYYTSFISAIFSLIGVTTFAVATHMAQGLYFPESLPATWGNSWAEVITPV